jgi:hypothetical protein
MVPGVVVCPAKKLFYLNFNGFFDQSLRDFGMDRTRLQEIISGGQTGVDRASLDVGLESGIPVGDYCPKGRRSEDGTIPAKYPLIETSTTNYGIRTEKNVIESDGTLIPNVGQVSSGTAYTTKMAKRHKKPFLLVQLVHKVLSESCRIGP